MNTVLLNTIELLPKEISQERKIILQPLYEYLKNKTLNNQCIRLNFICTHNSRRSIFSQVWAQSLAHYFNLKNIFCYSGGTETTSVFPKVIEVLGHQGFETQPISQPPNTVYAIKYDAQETPVICFSKMYHHAFNPASGFAAIMTCNEAHQGCPLVSGAEARFPVNYIDPKIYDATEFQLQKYTQTSLEIAAEWFWIFNKVTSNQPEA